MSLYNYQKSISIVGKNYPLDAIIMAAMQQSSGVELEKLKAVFSGLYYEVMERNGKPRGVIESDGR